MAFGNKGWRGVILAMLCGSSLSASAAPLDDELSALIQTHPLIKSGQAQVSASDKGVFASLAPYLPSADVTGEEGKGRVSLPAFRATPNGPFASEERNWNFSVKETLWDGGARDSARAQSKLQRDSANITLVGVRQTVLAEGINAYLNVLRQLELVKLSQQNEDNIRKQLHLEDERVKRGAGIAVDVLQAKSRLQISLERLTAVRGGLQEATARYEQVFSRPPETENMTLPPDPAGLLPATVDDAVAAALNEQPTVQNAAKQIDLTEQKQEGIEAEYQPKIDLVGSRVYQENFSGIPGIRRDTLGELKVSWNLFAGLGTHSRIQQTGYEKTAREDDLIQAKHKAEEQVRISWNTLKTAEERVSLLDNAVNIAAEVYESRKKLRESGKETVINVLDAENEVFNAQINYTSALYDSRIATYDVLRSMGRLEINTLKGVQ
ncbi:MAG: TolC family protein [Rhodospirillaceae bacterium]|nr:MAG: TolC family protein [Rhodospirillaceae bacterium]